MAPIKYEEQMKDKLEKRRLQPSPESWAALSNRLDAEQKKNNTSLFWWIGIAASIVGIVFITAMYFNNEPVQNDAQIIVDTQGDVKQDEQQKEKNLILEVAKSSNEVVVKESNSNTKSLNETVSNPKGATSRTKNTMVIEKLPEQDAIAQSQGTAQEATATSNSVENLADMTNTKLTFEDQKIQDVVAQINALSTNGNKVTDSEIDSLLKKAQKELLSNKLYNENTRTVDANALLQDVEEDLQQSFRSKVFEALQSGYESVVTAVTERNN